MVQSYLLSALAAQFPPGRDAAFLTRFPGPWLVWESGRWMPAPSAAVAGRTSAALRRPQLRRASLMSALGMHLRLARGQEQLTLGRDPSCDMGINDVTLSRVHLAFALKDGGWHLCDRGSRNGTVVDGAPLASEANHRLSDGEEIDAGDVLLTFAESATLLERLRQAAQVSALDRR